jgi:hypothetical protein
LELAAAVMRERILQGESATHAGEQLLKISERKGVRALEDPSAERHHRNNGLGRGLDTGGFAALVACSCQRSIATRLTALGRLMDSADDNIVSLLGELAFCANCPPLDSDACPA